MISRQRITPIVLFASGLLVGYVVFHRPLTSDRLPANVLARTYHQKTTHQLTGCYDIGIELSKDEVSKSRKCVGNFMKIREEKIKIRGSLREKTRWSIHTYLNAKSRIVDVGGYLGVDAAKYIRLANPYYTILEPVAAYYEKLKEKFSNNSKVTIYNFGLGKVNKNIKIGVIKGAATSLFSKRRKSSKQQTLVIRDAVKFFTRLNVQRTRVDLLAINCEGCEYELLEVLIASSLVRYFKHVQFQFHLDLPGIAHQECRYCQIMGLLRRTHKPMFQFSYDWQAWELK